MQPICSQTASPNLHLQAFCRRRALTRTKHGPFLVFRLIYQVKNRSQRRISLPIGFRRPFTENGKRVDIHGPIRPPQNHPIRFDPVRDLVPLP